MKRAALVLLLSLFAIATYAQQIPSFGTVAIPVTANQNAFTVLLTQNVTSFSFTGSLQSAPLVSVTFIQNSTGGFTVTGFASNITSNCSVSGTANTATVCLYQYNPGANSWTSAGSGSGGGTVNSGTQCEPAVYPATGTTVGASTAFCDASTFAGVDPTGATDSFTGLQNAINAAATASVELYLPAGTYKTSANLHANASQFRMRGAGPAVTSITASATGYNVLTIGTGTDGNQGPNGYVQGIHLIGATVPSSPTGISCLQLNAMLHYRVVDMQADTCDIGFDMINNNFATQFENIRGGFGGTLNVGLYLRNGAQSGSDISIYNAWINGKIAGVNIGDSGGGYHFYGGQITAGQGTGSPNDLAASVILCKDYLTSAHGSCDAEFFGTSFEGTDFAWIFRAFDQVNLATYSISINPTSGSTPAIGVFKVDTAPGNGRLSMHDTALSGNFSNSVLLTGINSTGVFLTETGTYSAANNPTIGGVKQAVYTMAAQSGISTSNYNALTSDGLSGKALVPPIPTSWTLVNATHNDSSGSTTSLAATAANHLANNLLVACFGSFNAGGAVNGTAPTNTAGDTFTLATGARGQLSGGGVECWWTVTAGNASDVVTAHWASSVSFVSLHVFQYSGNKGSANVFSYGDNATCSSCGTLSIPAHNATLGDLIISIVAPGSGAGFYSSTGGYIFEGWSPSFFTLTQALPGAVAASQVTSWVNSAAATEVMAVAAFHTASFVSN